MSSSHHLEGFLESRLPEIGLDYDLYGPYVLGLESEDGDGSTTTTTLVPKDEIEQVVELLRASSEKEELTEDDAVWEGLVDDILSKMKLDVDDVKKQQREEVRLQKEKFEQQLEQAKKEQAEESKNKDAAGGSSKPSNGMDDATKKAMLQRFAYEDDTADGDGGTEDAVPTNRDVAASTNLEKARELRSHKVHTKKEEQQKTKDQRTKKQQAKEDRRKRSTKGERRR